MKKIILISIPILVIIAGAGVWAVDYFALFQSNPIDSDEPVVVNQPVAEPQLDQQPAPTEVPYTLEQVTTDLVVPWSIVFTSETRWLVSERDGRIRVVNNGQLDPAPLGTFFDVSSVSEEGLMGLALDPDYANNKYVYACYARPLRDGLIDRVVRFTDLGDTFGPQEIIVDNIPAARFHAGCRLGFGPDDKLYITTGDAIDRNIAQDPTSLGGKILRINPDGSIPDDNPTAGSPVWSLGHRNSQGIAWQPGTNALFSTEHGPSVFDGPAGGDEINIIEPGANYGWPIVSHEDSDPRFIDPALVFTPAVAPAGATFYDGDVFPQFKGDFFFAALKGEGVIRVVLDPDQPSSILSFQKLPDVELGRIRDVVSGPDGYIYILTSNRDGRGDPREGDDAIYRLIPAE